MFKIVGNMKDKIRTLKKFSGDFERTLREIQESATIDAIETATENTPPQFSEGQMAGVGTITGTLKGAWASDSITKSKRKNGRYITLLANSTPYASFVNNGHRMDKHFVSGLMVNPYTGLLEKAPQGMNVGIMVGTKTTYVQGKFMLEEALKTYEQKLNKYIDNLIEDLNKNV